jgi:flagellin-like protein
MKGVSPLVASVLLIVITMGVAAVLATFVSSYTRQTLETTLPTCIGGDIVYVSANYPKWDDSTKKIIAVIEAQNVPLGDFKFDVILNNDTAFSLTDVQGLSLAPGATGTIISPSLTVSKTDIKQVRISTNCSNVKTEWATLR